jgi:hypothetical protein
MRKPPVLVLPRLAGLYGTLPGGALAKVTRFEITSKQPAGSFRSGDYVRWDGRIHGELSPAAETIADLDKPARNARGNVEYAARIMLFMPVAGGNGALLVDVPNRGHAYARALYNSPRGLPFQSGNLNANRRPVSSTAMLRIAQVRRDVAADFRDHRAALSCRTAQSRHGCVNHEFVSGG